MRFRWTFQKCFVVKHSRSQMKCNNKVRVRCEVPGACELRSVVQTWLSSRIIWGKKSQLRSCREERTAAIKAMQLWIAAQRLHDLSPLWYFLHLKKGNLVTLMAHLTHSKHFWGSVSSTESADFKGSQIHAWNWDSFVKEVVWTDFFFFFFLPFSCENCG